MDVVETISIKNYFDEILSVRFKAVDDKFQLSKEAVASALVSQKELYQTVQLASDRAITKAEEAQKQYNQNHNDLSRKMEDQYKNMIPRQEADQRQKNQEEKLEELNKQVSLLTTRLDEIRGTGVGIKNMYGWILAGLSILFIILNYFK